MRFHCFCNLIPLNAVFAFIGCMRLLLFAGLLFFMVSGCTETPVGEIQCTHDTDCPEGTVCYYSQLCSLTPDGVDCAQQEGDLQCHKTCFADSDCPLNAPRCQETSFFYGDVGIVKSICMK
jgi:hypothetical protein